MNIREVTALRVASNSVACGMGKAMGVPHWKPRPGADSPEKQVPRVSAEMQTIYLCIDSSYHLILAIKVDLLSLLPTKEPPKLNLWQPQCKTACHHTDRAARHRDSRPHRAEAPAGLLVRCANGKEDASRDRDEDAVVDCRPEKVELDAQEDALGECYQRGDSGEIRVKQDERGGVDGDVGP